ncbi:MAG: MotA/TolQ/ExbB proton channel family protein, partial [Bacteroidota bacterium]
MRQSVFIIGLLVSALAVAVVIFFFFVPQFIRDGGYLVILLIALSIMVITFVIERTISLKKIQGKGSLSQFLKEVEKAVEAKEFQQAITLCEAQKGALASILQAGFERYLELQRKKKPVASDKMVSEIQRAFEEATALEMPLLEKNLIAISTIASVSTMVGLLGTVLGMIRSFQALAQTGAPDAVQLSLGISEALINTAGGLIAAITGIVAYNVFVNKVDSFTYTLDDAVYNIV